MLRLRQDVVVAADHQPVAEVGLDVNIQNQAEHRQHREDEKPRELDGRVVVVAEQKQHDCRRQQRVAAPEVGQKALELVKGGKEKQDLHDQRKDDDARAAENDLHEASLALF